MPEMTFAGVRGIRLTIAIPTYNRHQCLASTVKRILLQLTPECQLLIIDNASQPPVMDVLGPVFTEFGISSARVVRNRTNVGGNANILRCMELCETEWLWTLADDDRVSDDAVERVLEGIYSNPNCICVTFAQKAAPRSESSTTCGRTAFLSALGPNFSSLCFISTSVYRLNAILPSLIYGYLQIPSCAPHLAVLVMAVNGSEKVHFSAKSIVEYIPARKGAGWSRFWVERGLPLLLDLPLAAQDRALLRKALRTRLRFKTLLASYVDVLCYGLRTRDLAVCAQLYRMTALRRSTVTASLFESVVGWALFITLLAPSVALWITGILYCAVKGRPLQEWASAVGSGPEERV